MNKKTVSTDDIIAEVLAKVDQINLLSDKLTEYESELQLWEGATGFYDDLVKLKNGDGDSPYAAVETEFIIFPILKNQVITKLEEEIMITKEKIVELSWSTQKKN